MPQHTPPDQPHPDVLRSADVFRNIIEWLSGIRLRVLLRRLLGRDVPAPASSPRPGTTPAPTLRWETWRDYQRRLLEEPFERP